MRWGVSSLRCMVQAISWSCAALLRCLKTPSMFVGRNKDRVCLNVFSRETRAETDQFSVVKLTQSHSRCLLKPSTHFLCCPYLLNFGVLNCYVGLCVSVSVFACLRVLHDFVNIQFICRCVFLHMLLIHALVSDSWIFKLCECFCAFALNVADKHSWWRPGRWEKNSSRRFSSSETTSNGPLHRSVYEVAGENSFLF